MKENIKTVGTSIGRIFDAVYVIENLQWLCSKKDTIEGII